MGKKLHISDDFLAKFQPLKKEPEQRIIRFKILIVCEGKETEPNYFESLVRHINKEGVFVVRLDDDSKAKVEIDAEAKGKGENTKTVVATAIKLRDKEEKSGIPYDCVWTVFDRDSFPKEKFNAAIEMSLNSGIRCAYSNEAFELWFLFHFANRITAMSRKEYEKSIEDQINAFADSKNKKDLELCKLYKRDFPKGFKYKKNDKRIFEYLMRYGSLDNAIKWAKKQQSTWTDKRYTEHNPTTLVYELVETLLGRDDDFNNQLANKL